MIRIPSVDHSALEKLFTINLSYEVLSLDQGQGNTGFSINVINKSRFQYGISFVNPENPTNSMELGIHLQKNMLVYGNVHCDIGVHDILHRQGNNITNGLDTREISLFAVLSSEKTFQDYAISTHIGFGTGKIVQDAQNDTQTEEEEAAHNEHATAQSCTSCANCTLRLLAVSGLVVF